MRAYVAEGIGTAMLLISVVGSGIMAETLADGNVALALWANAAATAAMLWVIITILGPVSGAHFNPAVTLYFALRGGIALKRALVYVVVQVLGGIIGVWLAHGMFDMDILQWSTTDHRTGPAQWLSEGLATMGLLFAIVGGLAVKPNAVPALVAVYIGGAYWFTASTSFANPAVTVARTMTDTFAGILPAHAPVFILVQMVAAVVAAAVLPGLFARNKG